MLTLERPSVLQLDDRDIQAILARNITGRIAFVKDGEIEIRPVTYVYSGDSIYLRSAGSGALAATDPEGAVVGFEVDEIHTTRRWRSVVIRGTLFRVSRDRQHEQWMRALWALRRLSPDILRQDDPAAHRDEIFRILIREATGRAMI